MSNKKTVTPANKPVAREANGNWKKGQSGNPAGAPKRGESWAEIIKRIGDLTPAEAASRSLELSKQFLKVGEGVTLKEAVVLRVYGSLLFEPTSGLLNSFMDRVEGKIADTHVLMDWREEAKKRGHDPDELLRQFVAAMGNRPDGGGGDDSDEPSETSPAENRSVSG